MEISFSELRKKRYTTTSVVTHCDEVIVQDNTVKNAVADSVIGIQLGDDDVKVLEMRTKYGITLARLYSRKWSIIWRY